MKLSILIAGHNDECAELWEQRTKDMRAALEEMMEAVNPPDCGGISLDIWNKRLKAASEIARRELER